MPIEQKFLAVFLLCCWVGIWWLALRIIAGKRFGLLEWMPIAFLAFGLPFMVSEFSVAAQVPELAGPFMIFWASSGILIDAVWFGRRTFAWYARRKLTRAEALRPVAHARPAGRDRALPRS